MMAFWYILLKLDKTSIPIAFLAACELRALHLLSVAPTNPKIFDYEISFPSAFA